MLGQNASTKPCCYLKIKTGEEVTTYYFDQVNDLEEHCEKLLESMMMTENKKKKKDKIPESEVEISISYNNQTANEKVVANLTLLKETLQKLKIQLQIPFKG